MVAGASKGSQIQEWRRNWPVALAAAGGMSMSVIHVYWMGAFVAPIEAELKWSRADIASGLTLLTIVGALLHPLVGRAVDRWGPRAVAIPGLILYWIGLTSLSLVTSSLVSWWLLWIFAGIGSTTTKPTVWVAAVASTFRASRGLALAIALSGMAISSSLIPLCTTYYISHIGWRGAFAAVASTWGVIVLPLVVLMFRTKPEHAAVPDQPAPPPQDLAGLTVREGLLSSAFIRLAVVAVVTTLVIPTTVINLIPILSQKGFSREMAAGMGALIGIASVAGRLLSGILLDRFDPRFIGAFSLLPPVVALLLLIGCAGSPLFAMLAIVILGFSLGSEIDVITYMLSRAMGLRHFGFFMAIITTCWTIATGSGPLIAASVYDWTGSYDAFLTACIPAIILCSLLLFTIRAPAVLAEPVAGEAQLAL
jgi:MFS family permease